MELLEVQKEADGAFRKAIIFGIGSLILAGVFGWMLARLGGAGPEIKQIVVAAETVPPLTPLKRSHLKLLDWPSAAVPVGAFLQIEDVINPNQLNLSGLVAGEPVLASRLSTPERGLGVSQLIEPSMRAYVVEVNDAVAKSQMIHPGAFVDVIATLIDPRSHENESVTKVILQNKQVLAVGDSVDLEARPTDKDSKTYSEERTREERHKVVTLLVDLNDLEPLVFAATQGKIDLALRSNVDTEIVPTTGANTERVLGQRSPVVETKALTQAPESHLKPRPRPRSTTSSGPSIYKVRR